MERLDYLLYCLKQEGIYCFMDLLTYRRFKTDEGLENTALLPDAAKPYCMYNDRMIELQKDFCTQIWTHVNPYTGLAYRDDPMFVMVGILNECDLFSSLRPIKLEPYKSEFLQKLDIWLKRKGIDRTAAEFDVLDYKDETLIDFKLDLQHAYYKAITDHMRALGVKIPISGNNWACSQSNLLTQLQTDFYDNHPYLYDFRWKEGDYCCASQAITRRRESFLFRSCFTASPHMPTFNSEWDMPWPNEYRAESPLYAAAVGMLQGWSGFSIHTYAYSAHTERMDMLGHEIFAPKIGGSPAREGVYSTWIDPAKFGLFYHAALITRRGDVARANNTLIYRHADRMELDPARIYEHIERSAVIFDASETAPR